MKTNEIIEFFIQSCNEIFGYLVKKYRFCLQNTQKDNMNCNIVYKKRFLRVTISYDLKEREIRIMIEKEALISKIIPYFPKSSFIDINYLVFLKTKRRIEQEYNTHQSDFESIKHVLNELSLALILYANAILQGDFNEFRKITTEIEKNEKQLINSHKKG